MDGYQFRTPPNFDGFSDSSHADCKFTGKSTAGHCFFLGTQQACVEAISKILPDVGNSTTENEYIGLSRGAQSGYYVKLLIDELGCFKDLLTYTMFEDNQASLNALKKNVAQSKFRHVRTRWHYLRDLVREKIVGIRKIHTDHQVADIFTKPLFGQKLNLFTGQLLGHIPRSHDGGTPVDMDYQPNIIKQEKQSNLTTKEIKSSQNLMDKYVN